MTATVVDRLSRQDAQILALGRATVRGHTAKVMVLEPSQGAPLPTLAAIRARIEARLHLAPRFRRRVLPTPLRLAAPVWADDPEFDVKRHVVELARERELDAGGLRAVVAELLTERLDRAHPLWHLAVARLAGGRMALIWRVHHALADGTSCVRIASLLLWDRLESDRPGSLATWRPSAPPGSAVLMRSGARDRVGALVRRRPAPLKALRGAPELRRVLRRELQRDATLTPLATIAGPRRAVAFASSPLVELRRAGKAIDSRVTVNDVVLATIAGALRGWLPERPGAQARIRVKVPVSLHGTGQDEANHDSYFFTELPVHEPDPAERVRAVSRETRERKLHHDAETLYHLGLHPAFARAAMSPHVFTFNVSNVPGPAGPVTMLGATVSELYSLAEIAHQHALRIAVISLAGRLFVGLNADADAVGELPALAAGIEQAAMELVQAAG